MRSTARLLVTFVLFNLFIYTRALRSVKDMNWETDPRLEWTPGTQDDPMSHRIVVFVLNIPNYFNNGLEKTFIASGVLLDNIRILTSYNPFRSLISSSELTENILALLVTGARDNVVVLRIANIVCGRQIAYVPDYENGVWHDSLNSPLHDLMVIRMEEEIGIAYFSNCFSRFNNYSSYYWRGILSPYKNSMISFPAGPDDQIDPEVMIISLGYRKTKERWQYDRIFQTVYEDDDAVLVDCEEWLPREWGFFICIRHIDDFPGLGSGALLYSRNKLFGIGSFAMFKDEIGVLVFTDVRYYEELITKTCGDYEFI